MILKVSTSRRVDFVVIIGFISNVETFRLKLLMMKLEIQRAYQNTCLLISLRFRFVPFCVSFQSFPQTCQREIVSGDKILICFLTKKTFSCSSNLENVCGEKKFIDSFRLYTM